MRYNVMVSTYIELQVAIVIPPFFIPIQIVMFNLFLSFLFSRDSHLEHMF